MIRHPLCRAAAGLAVLMLPLAVAAQGAKQDKPAAAPPAKPAVAATLAKVNGVAIPARRADLLVRERLAQGQKDSPQLHAAIKEDLIRREAIAQVAKQAGYEKRADVQAEIDLLRQTIIVQHYLRDWLARNPVSDTDIQAEYDRAKSQTGDKEYRARHILVETEDQAKNIIAELKKGGSFDDLAEKNSKDTGNKARGGDLDWNVPTVFDKVFSEAMTKLEKGQLTETPVHTRFGYHVIRLDDVRPVKFPQLSEVKSRIQQQLQQRKIEGLVQSLRAKAKIE
ncbi:MAG: peptidylprolyl isomerase [Betaproteobacteria bacterium]|nr:peptidylprolyl isomerase [Betaproteobacteria bacterium]